MPHGDTTTSNGIATAVQLAALLQARSTPHSEGLALCGSNRNGLRCDRAPIQTTSAAARLLCASNTKVAYAQKGPKRISLRNFALPTDWAADDDIDSLRSRFEDDVRLAAMQLPQYAGHFFIERVFAHAIIGTFTEHKRLNHAAQQRWRKLGTGHRDGAFGCIIQET